METSAAFVRLVTQETLTSAVVTSMSALGQTLVASTHSALTQKGPSHAPVPEGSLEILMSSVRVSVHTQRTIYYSSSKLTIRLV